VRHPLAAHPHHRRNGGTARKGAEGAGTGPAVGEPGLRTEDTRLGGNGSGPAQDGRSGGGHARVGDPVRRRGGAMAPPSCRPRPAGALRVPAYSTVTDLARLRGLSTSVPRARAVW